MSNDTKGESDNWESSSESIKHQKDSSVLSILVMELMSIEGVTVRNRSVRQEVVQVESKWDVANNETRADNKLDIWQAVRVKKVLQGNVEGIALRIEIEK